MRKLLIAYMVYIAAISMVRSVEPPNVRYILTVVTPEGRPVVGARVGIGGGLGTPDREYPRNPKGYTDGSGQFSAILGSSHGHISGSARLDGYYESEIEGVNLASNGETIDAAYARGKWEPWERSFRLVLKPIKNPVSMYAKRVVSFLPEMGKPVGYDLEVGDWVAPYGKGACVDFEFIGEGRVDSDVNYSGVFTLRLPGEGNGILAQDMDYGSKLRMPYEAPLDGYSVDVKWRYGRTTEDKPDAISTFVDESNSRRGFIFRVRTALGPDGRILSAKYGKVHGPVRFSPRLSCQWALTIIYYFNPDGTRNLEFDPKRNLFTDLKDDERVVEP